MRQRVASGLRRNDVVLVSFPFTDLSTEKLRPALVVGRPFVDDVVLAFVTSRADAAFPEAECVLPPSDPEFRTTGLKVASRIRLNKLATLHRTLVRRRLGRIGPHTRRGVDRALRFVLDL